MRDNEKKYNVAKTWKMTFNYEAHKNVKKFRPFIKEMVGVIREHTYDAKITSSTNLLGHN